MTMMLRLVRMLSPGMKNMTLVLSKLLVVGKGWGWKVLTLSATSSIAVLTWAFDLAAIMILALARVSEMVRLFSMHRGEQELVRRVRFLIRL